MTTETAALTAVALASLAFWVESGRRSIAQVSRIYDPVPGRAFHPAVDQRYSRRTFSTIKGDRDGQRHFLTVISEPTEKAKKHTLSHAPW